MKERKTMHYVYKITNLINGKIYIGKHSSNDIKNDHYLGGGKYIKRAIEKYGKQNFKMEILYQFKNQEQTYAKQRQIVTRQFALSKQNYNLVQGGRGYNGTIPTKDKNGEIFMVYHNDERYLNGELKHVSKGKVTVRDRDGSWHQITIDQYNNNKDYYTLLSTGEVVVKDQEGNIHKINKDDPRYLSGQLKHISVGTIMVKYKNGNVGRIKKEQYDEIIHQPITKGHVTVKDKNGNTLLVSINDPRYISGQLVHNTTGMIPVKDKNGNTLQICKDDPRWLNGQLKGVSKGLVTVLNKETNQKETITKEEFKTNRHKYKHNAENTVLVIDNSGKRFRVSIDDPRYLSGELVHVNKGTVVVKDKDGNIFQVSKDDPRWLNGQLKGVSKGKIRVFDQNGKIRYVHQTDPRYLSGQYSRNK